MNIKHFSASLLQDGNNSVLCDHVNEYLDFHQLACLISIDPGYNTAIACIDRFNVEVYKYSLPPIKQSEEFKLIIMQNQFDAKLDELRAAYADYTYPIKVYIEDVAVWGGAAAGGKANAGGISEQSEVSSARGDLLKLARLIGTYGSVCTYRGVSWNLITAINWKGQLTKKATKFWVERELGCKLTCTDHEIDAMGIGLSIIRKWKESK